MKTFCYQFPADTLEVPKTACLSEFNTRVTHRETRIMPKLGSFRNNSSLSFLSFRYRRFTFVQPDGFPISSNKFLFNA